MAGFFDFLKGLLQTDADRARDVRRRQKREAADEETFFADARNWTPVQSSNVAAVSRVYKHPQTGNVLGVRFLNGSEYRYNQVPGDISNSMINSTSKGRFVWQYLRDQYPFQKVR